jgi:hypothetical protein
MTKVIQRAFFEHVQKIDVLLLCFPRSDFAMRHLRNGVLDDKEQRKKKAVSRSEIPNPNQILCK